MHKIIKDRVSLNDKRPDYIKMPKVQSHGLWARTEILGSNDEAVYDENGFFSHFAKKVPTGRSSLGETLFRTEKVAPKFKTSNMVPIGGCQYVMELLYGVTVADKKITIPTLYDSEGIGASDHESVTSKYTTPTSEGPVEVPAIHDVGNFVQLFGVGVTGTAESDIPVYSVKYTETGITMTTTDDTPDKTELNGQMIPFRYRQEGDLTPDEKIQYFGKKATGDVTGYYLKKFSEEPKIRHIVRSGEDAETEKELEDWSSINNAGGAIESFTECTLKITKDDIREYFISIGQEDRSRINTIALFSGQYDKDKGDYCNVRMFSKLIIPVEYLSMSKDLTLVYRVYTA